MGCAPTTARPAVIHSHAQGGRALASLPPLDYGLLELPAANAVDSFKNFNDCHSLTRTELATQLPSKHTILSHPLRQTNHLPHLLSHHTNLSGCWVE